MVRGSRIDCLESSGLYPYSNASCRGCQCRSVECDPSTRGPFRTHAAISTGGLFALIPRPQVTHDEREPRIIMSSRAFCLPALSLPRLIRARSVFVLTRGSFRCSLHDWMWLNLAKPSDRRKHLWHWVPADSQQVCMAVSN